MSPRNSLIAPLFAGLALVGSSAQDRLPDVPPIPVEERFVQVTGLRVQLIVDRASVAAFEDPGFRAVFENVGRTNLYLNPRVASNVYLFDDAGRPVTPVAGYLAETFSFRIERKDLVLLRPGGRWTVPLLAEHHDSVDEGKGQVYGLERRMLLRGGRYAARFLYISEPGFTAWYNLRDLRDIWEGRLTSDSVSFTVSIGAEGEIEKLERERAAYSGENPASFEAAEKALRSSETRIVAGAAAYLTREHSTSSIPRLQVLVNDPRPPMRSIGLRALLTFDRAEARAAALAAVNDPDSGVMQAGRRWMTEHCSSGDLPVVEGWFARSSAEWAEVVAHCGSADDFERLRAWAASNPSPSQGLRALGRLTFFGSSDCAGIDWRVALEDDWEKWHVRHRAESRTEWAIAAARADCPGAASAGHYLRHHTGDSLALLRQAASTDSAAVRIGAAVAIARSQRLEGIALLRRDIMNREPTDCAAAIAALSELTQKNEPFDCHLPADRERALAILQ